MQRPGKRLVRSIVSALALLAIAGGALLSSSSGADAAGSCATDSAYSRAVSGTAGLLGYWRLGDSTGTVACDAKGTNPGTYAGGFTLGQAGALAGDSDTGTAFNGSSGEVSVPSSTSLNAGDRFTIEAWVKRGSTGTTQVIASKQTNAWMLLFNTQNRLVLQQAGSTAINTSTVAVTDTGGWHHVVATKNASTVRLYIDGEDVTGTTSNRTLANNTLPLVMAHNASTSRLNGSLDEVALYNIALTAGQVSNHYLLARAACSQGSSRYAQNVTAISSLKGYWRLGEPSGTTACDTAGKNPGSYQGTFTLGRPGAINGDGDTATGLNGSTAWVSVPALPALDTGDTFTVEAWIKRGTVGGTANQVIASKQGSAWTLLLNTSNRLVLQQSNSAITTSTASVADTTAWHHVAATKAGATVRLYLDGRDVTGAVTNRTLLNSTSPLAIGQRSGSWFNGTIDDVALYSTALSAAQLAEHHSIGASPGNLTAPSVSGELTDGKTLTAAPGTWQGANSYAYRWQTCDSSGGSCADIAGATGQTHGLGSSDVGTTLRVVVTATNSFGSTLATSEATGAVQAAPPVNTTAPSLSGSAEEGSTLEASPGSWSGTPGSYTYQWQACDQSGSGCADISGATGSSYRLAGADVGDTVRVLVTSTNSAGSATAASVPSDVVTPTPPVNTSAPTVSGTARDGQTLTSDPGAWSGSPSYSHQWQTCDSAGGNCTDINGATGETLTLRAAEVGLRVRLVVTGTNAAGSATAASEPTSPVSAVPPTNVSPPAISGKAAAGQTLTASLGDWSGTTPSYSVQWRRCNSSGATCSDIAGATGQAYTVGTTDVGSTLRVVVVATNAAGTASATSAQTAPATAALPDPNCTAMWTGAAGNGSWETAGNWSPGVVPGPSDFACVPEGVTVTSSGSNRVDAVNVQGRLVLRGSFEVIGANRSSVIRQFTLDEGTLTGAGIVNVVDSFSWTGGRMIGAGQTVLAPGASGTIDNGGYGVELDTRTFRNRGLLTVTQTGVEGKNGAFVDNQGTMDVNSEGGCTFGCNHRGAFNWRGDATVAPRFVNTGTVRKTAGGSWASIGIPFDNQGSVTSQSGELRVTDGSVGGTASSGSWSSTGAGATVLLDRTHLLGAGVQMSGAVTIAGQVTAQDVQAPAGTVTLRGTLSLEGPTASNIQRLAITTGALSGAGTANINESLDWRGGSMAGSGTTVIPSGAVATLDPGASSLGLHGRTLRNRGTLNQVSGGLNPKNGAVVDNSGSFTINGEGGGHCCSYSFAGGVYQHTYTGQNNGAPSGLVNTGTVKKTAGAGFSEVSVPFHNEGSVIAESGTLHFKSGSVPGTSSSGSWAAPNTGTRVRIAGVGLTPFVLGANVPISGAISFGGLVEAQDLQGPQADVEVVGLSLVGPAESNIARVTMREASLLSGSGTLNVHESLDWTGGSMNGPGTTVITPSATGTVNPPNRAVWLDGRTLRNRGLLKADTGGIGGTNGALVDNRATFNLNGEGGGFICCTFTGGLFYWGDYNPNPPPRPVLYNRGLVQKTAGTGTTEISWARNNPGTIVAHTGRFDLKGPDITQYPGDSAYEQQGGSNDAIPGHEVSCAGKPVNCATGNQYEIQNDFAAGGRGLGLELTRVYNSQVAARASSAGAFGYGWTGSYRDRLAIDRNSRKVTVHHDNGSTVQFTITPSGPYMAADWVRAELRSDSDGGYTYTLPDRRTYKFDSNGRLVHQSDRNGNRTVMSYDGPGDLRTVTDPVGRTISFSYNGDHTVDTATDPAGGTMKYGYTAGNLTSVTRVGVSPSRWQFGYDGVHQMTSMTDARGKTTTTAYDSSRRAISQTDALNRTRTWDYIGTNETRITNPQGDVTRELFENNLLTERTRAYGTADATTEKRTYDGERNLTSITDGNDHSETYGYDSSGNRTSVTDGNGHTSRFTFNGARDMTSATPPVGAKTTIGRDARGNPTSLTRIHETEAGSQTQTVTFGYNGFGELTSLTNPLNKTWTFTRNSQGDLASSTSPTNETTSWGYDVNSRLTSTVSPSQETSTITRDEFGRPKVFRDTLGKEITLDYDANGNVTDVTDQLGKHTQINYDAENQATEVVRADSTTEGFGYDRNGRATSYTNGNGKATTYGRDLAGLITSVTDPLNRVTRYEHDGAGNVTRKTDALDRVTTYSYDGAGALTAIDYSDEGTPDATFGYDAAGRRTSSTDGTGSSSYGYDDLGRMVRATDGAGKTTRYAYDLADQQTALTYPNAKTVSRAFDPTGRMESITDWLGNTTTFGYDADSNMTSKTFAAPTGNRDEYAHDSEGRLLSVTMKRGADTLASLSYTRDAAGQLATVTQQGLPGPGTESFGYDLLNRLTQAGNQSFGYDGAGNPTNGGSKVFDDANQLTSSPEASYEYNAVGERIKTTPPTGSATAYDYDQQGNLSRVARDGDAAIGYDYDANGLRTGKTRSGATSGYSWDRSSGLPSMLADGDQHFVHGPDGVPLEQISSTGEVQNFHHDQLGSTRILTDSSGQPTGLLSYDAWGNSSGSSGAASARLGYAGQYLDEHTGLQYLRARDYDSRTQQFTTRDPLEAQSRDPYSYAGNDPANYTDPAGLISKNDVLNKLNSVAGPDSLWGKIVPDKVSETAAGAFNGVSFGKAADFFDVNPACFGEAFRLGELGSGFIPGLGWLGMVGRVGRGASVTSKARRTPGADGSESVIIKERLNDGSTAQVIHQVGRPLPGGGVLVVHQHPLHGPRPGAQLTFPVVER